ncbi:hypothetical protein [Alkanindiges hydrocarboniclasticus]|nr:hypothetical protein [Alkanindiges hydrocarboniclasticus]
MCFIVSADPNLNVTPAMDLRSILRHCGTLSRMITLTTGLTIQHD